MPEMPFSHGPATRVLIVDDHPIIREGLTHLLVQEDLHVCCAAATTEEALTAMACQPDIAIVDLSLQSDSGLDLIRTLRQRHPNLAILVLSMHDETLFAERALRDFTAWRDEHVLADVIAR